MTGGGTGWRTSVRSPPRLVVFIDYQCHFCRLFNDSTEALMQEHPEFGIRVRHLPHPAKALSREASLAAICADREGRFAAMHEYLLNAQWAYDESWAETSQQVGIADRESFDACLTSDEAASALADDSLWASRLELKATPAVLTG